MKEGMNKISHKVLRIYVGFVKATGPFLFLLCLFGAFGGLVQLLCILGLASVISMLWFKYS